MGLSPIQPLSFQEEEIGTQIQREDHVKMQGAGGNLQAKERGPEETNFWHLDSGLRPWVFMQSLLNKCLQCLCCSGVEIILTCSLG